MDDWALLEQYARDDSRAALDTLVRRHVGMVYSTACREVGDPHLAEDVTQAVFLVLMRRARQLSRRIVLAGWLFKVTRYAAADARKSAARFDRRQREAAMLRSETHATADDPNEVASEIAPLLNDAIASLSGGDRDAIVLKFLQGKSHQEVAEELHLSENAARQRVFRALGKLRRRFQSKGYNAPEDVFGAAMLAVSTHSPPPANWASSLGSSLHDAVSARATTIAAETIRRMIMMKVKALTIACATIALILSATAFALHSSAPVQQVALIGQTPATSPSNTDATGPAATPPAVAVPNAAIAAKTFGPAATPKGTVLAAFDAALAGDESGHISCFDQPSPAQQATLRMVVHAFAAASDLRSAIRDQFGEAQATQLFQAFNMGVDRPDVDSSVEQVTGATAEVDMGHAGPGKVPLVKVGDVWLISSRVLDTLNTRAVAQLDRKAKAVRQVATDIRAGKLDSMQNVQESVMKVINSP